MSVTTYDVEKYGIDAILKVVDEGFPCAITEDGKPIFYVISVDDYQGFKQWRLDKALENAKGDYASGNFKIVSNVDDFVDTLAGNHAGDG